MRVVRDSVSVWIVWVVARKECRNHSGTGSSREVFGTQIKHHHPHLRLVHQRIEPLSSWVDVDLEDCLPQVVCVQETPGPVKYVNELPVDCLTSEVLPNPP